MISGNEKNTASSVNEEIKDIIMSSYTQDELFQALLFSVLLEEVLSPIDDAIGETAREAGYLQRHRNAEIGKISNRSS